MPNQLPIKDLKWINTHGRVLRGELEAYVTTGADREGLMARAEEFVSVLCRRLHLQAARTRDKVRDVRHRLIPKFLERHSGLRGEALWEAFVADVLYSVSVAEDEQYHLPAAGFNDSIAGGHTAKPNPVEPGPDIERMERDLLGHRHCDFLRSSAEFQDRLFRAATPIYQMIKEDPVRHSSLLALFVALGAEVFEEFIREYAGTSFRVPSVEELAAFERDRVIVAARASGQDLSEIAKEAGLSNSRVSQILTTQRKQRRNDPELDAALIREMSRIETLFLRADVKTRLHS
jgi:hypothetical protein